MRRLLVGTLLLVVFLMAGYGYFKSSPPTAMAVVETFENSSPVKESPVVSDVVVDEQPVVQKPESVSVNNLAMNSVWVFNTKDGSVLDMLQVGSSPSAVEVSPNGFWLYVLNSGADSISVIDAETFSVVKTLSLGEEPRTIRLSPDGSLLAVVTYVNHVLLFETKNLKQVGIIDVNKKPADAVFSFEGKYLFSVSEKTNLLEKINPYVGKAISVAEVGKSPVALAITHKDRAFVVNSGSDGVSVIDLVDFSRDKKYDISVGSKPVAIVLGNEEKLAYVANKESDSVTVFDATTYKVVSDISVGKSPVNLVFNRFVGTNGVLYSANEGSNDVSVVDTSSLKEIVRWKTGGKPSAMALSPDGGFLFVAMKK